jgi:ComF family protein
MNWFVDFLDLVFPRTCEACSEVLLSQEKMICTTCMMDLPRTNFKDSEVELSRKFWGKLPVANTLSFLKFTKKGKVQKLLHQLKYREKPELGVFLGELFGSELKRINFNEKIDIIVSVPLHKEKEKQRGYNQADCIAKGLSNSLGIPFEKGLVTRTKFTETQTKKNRFERYQNVENIFEIKDLEAIKDKRIAIVDDVLTTGSTLESCGIVLLECGCSEVSIMTIASAF